jgi:hypothetical protein
MANQPLLLLNILNERLAGQVVYSDA